MGEEKEGGMMKINRVRMAAYLLLAAATLGYSGDPVLMHGELDCREKSP